MKDEPEWTAARDASRDWRSVLAAWVLVGCLAVGLLLRPTPVVSTSGYDPGISHGLALGADRLLDPDGEAAYRAMPAKLAKSDPAGQAAPGRTVRLLHAIALSVGGWVRRSTQS